MSKQTEAEAIDALQRVGPPIIVCKTVLHAESQKTAGRPAMARAASRCVLSWRGAKPWVQTPATRPRFAPAPDMERRPSEEEIDLYGASVVP